MYETDGVDYISPRMSRVTNWTGTDWSLDWAQGQTGVWTAAHPAAAAAAAGGTAAAGDGSCSAADGRSSGDGRTGQDG